MSIATVRYLGQVGFLIRKDGLRVVIDPYLTDSVDRLPGFPPGFLARNYPPPVTMDEMDDIDLVLCTHDHLDHADPETLRGIAKASPGCRFAGPRLTVTAMHDAGIAPERTAVLKAEVAFGFRGLIVEPVAAAHEGYEVDAQGYDRFFGYVLYWNGLRLYHAGDTVLTPRLVESLRTHRLHVAFLPINGRSDERRRLDIVGNMDAAEAMRLAHELAAGKGLELVVPTHYDLYDANGADLAGFLGAWEATPEPKPRFKAMLPGEEIEVEF